MKIIGLIPARLSASRFDKKLLKDLCGKPVIVRTYEAVVNTKIFHSVYVITDSDEPSFSACAAASRITAW